MQSNLALLLILWLLPLAGASAAGGWQQEYDALLAKYVVDGGVRYAAWKANAQDMAALDRVVAAIGRESPDRLSRNEQLAFYINAYNAWTIRLVLDKYPIKSVWEHSPLAGIFTRKLIRVDGEKMSLNHLEKEIILKRFKDSRAHFAMNCASGSCPPLQRKAYDGKALDQQLDERTKSFTLNSLGVKPSADGRKAQVSSIFKWYDDDFAKDGGAAAYINKARPGAIAPDAKVEYQKYDWSLNERK